MENNELKTADYVVAFIDVLGATSKICNDVDDSLNIIHRVYKDALISCGEVRNILKNDSEKPIVRIFSDNIVMACPVNTHGIDLAFRIVAGFVSIIQNRFMDNNIIVRGGISYGSFFSDDVMVWGQALVHAYNIESSLAIYPRIIIDKALFEKVDISHFLFIPVYIKCDGDGEFFVDHLNYNHLEKDNVDRMIEHYQKLDATIECLVLEATSNTKALQKINWLKNYLGQTKKDYCEYIKSRGETHE